MNFSDDYLERSMHRHIFLIMSKNHEKGGKNNNKGGFVQLPLLWARIAVRM